ncbi:DNA internalization-related competence protein ComEC/Rec2 [Rubrivivax gelatinosus]|uniref:Competence protein ComEC n=1 Tax=Rubrivivax gelatinosus TaxID=28068 RepID=A0A4R2MBB4_RUBGE|nr:DNA internalization-related competence protein ComEC/Rec2 [Rubrivivax gelatinosus]MBK1688085.1 DNA internalization-related competence protein ComEC/Rec2 [Rubrivivax gelatinosus]TCP03810.1 competence protein ComEC [Rubrivivax gelatinosus]
MRGRNEPATRGWWAPAAGWLAGTLLQLQQPALRSPAEQALLAAAALAILALAWCCRPPAWRHAGLAVAAAALAFAASDWRAARRLDQGLAPELAGAELVLTAVVVRLPAVHAGGVRFVVETERATTPDGRPVTLPPRIVLGWYADGDARPPVPAVGERWRWGVRLKPPHGAFNPHGWDAELAWFVQGIGATGSVRSAPAPLRLAVDTAAPLERWRQRVRDAVFRQVGDPAAAGVLAALAIGDQAAIDREDWEVFRLTGVAHLMSISGLHVTMFAWLAGAAIGRLWRRSGRGLLWLPAPQAARWGGLACATAYALAAGWGVPAQRTVGMLATVVVLRSVGRRWPLPAVLLAAALAVVLIDPWALLQPGFWLSFVAVALLAMSGPAPAARPALADEPRPWRRRWTALREAARGGLRTQAVASVGLAPLSMLFFQQVSGVGFVANLLAIPLVTLVVTPLALAGVLLPPLWSLAAGLLDLLRWGLATMAAWPWASWTAAAAPPWAVAAGLLGGLLAVLPLPWRLRWLAVPLMLPLLAPPVPRPAEGRFELVAADVGQGSALLLRTARHLLVFDAGPRWGPEADAGSRVLLPLLRARGERRIDLLMLSHRDTDHVGGAAALLAALPVGELVGSLPDGHPLLGAVPHRRCRAGERWRWDGVEFELLHPPAGMVIADAASNATSCVLRVRGSLASVLLPGDLPAAQELALVASGAPLAADVLVVPHHGSRSSSSEAFVAAVAPRFAVVQAGYRNRFGHPAPEVSARFAARGIPLLRSDACGAWTLSADGLGSCERERSPRYWHHRPSSP